MSRVSRRSKPWLLRAIALRRHYQILWGRGVSFMSEYATGTVSFLRWTPRLIRNLWVLFMGLPRERKQFIVVLSDVPVWFINLDHRKDRRISVESALEARGLTNFERFPATLNDLGILGCTQSHIGVLEKIETENHDLAMVCEDDIEFLGFSDEIRQAIQEFVNTDGLDVLCLAYRLRAPRLRLSQRFALANSIQTASCYVVKRKAVGPLLQSFRESEQMLLDGVPPRIAANDMHWKKTQTNRLLFAITRKRLARQRPSFSDVVGKFKDYRA